MGKKRTRTAAGTDPRLEIRVFPADFELRQEDGDGPGTLIGHPIVYNSRSVDLGGWFEEIAPGAFSRSLGSDDIVALWSHEMRDVLGRTSSKTLQLKDSKKSMESRISLPDTTVGRDAAVLVKRQDVKGMSFGFWTRRAEWTKLEDDEAGTVYLRTVLEGSLVEVSPVAFPAYPQTDVAMRSFRQYRSRMELRERRLRRLHQETELSRRRLQCTA